MLRMLAPAPQVLLSDHMPFLVKSEEKSATKNPALVGWNMLCQIKFNNDWNYFTSGFACNRDIPETEQQYISRIRHVAAQLGVAIRKTQADFICLQECPETEELRKIFIAETQKHLIGYEHQFFKDSDNDYFLMTFYNTSEYAINTELTDDVSRATLNSGLKERVLSLVFQNKMSGEKLLVINAHANFGKEMKSDVDVLHAWAKNNKLPIVLLGDCNRDLVKKSDDISKHDISESLDAEKRLSQELHVNAVDASSFISKAVFELNDKGEKVKDKNGNVVIKEVRTFVETRDGSISSFPVTTECMVDINRPNAYLNETSDLSKDLTKCPEDFIANLVSVKSNHVGFAPTLLK
jgi:endonuclease/exonuclease/phosphatase family metal-dependent hydrolase